MLYIRTDANKKIGMGHLMRCISIADAARKMGIETLFIFSNEESVPIITEKGYDSLILNSHYDALEDEIDSMKLLVMEHDIKKLLIDSYMVTEKYLESLSELTETVYIDDLNMFRYPVSTLICYEGYFKKFKFEEMYKGMGTRLLLGTDYAPLREVFSQIGDKTINEKAEELLILSGGGDQRDALEKLIDSINMDDYKRVVIICGLFYNDSPKLSGLLSRHSNVQMFHNVLNIHNYMLSADIALSAGGTSLFELSACGTPTISYIIADNQIDNALYFDEAGLIETIGDVRGRDISNELQEKLLKYSSPEVRRAKSCAMRNIIDGKGAMRIVKEGFSL